jgi:type I restriction enzyme S subunit
VSIKVVPFLDVFEDESGGNVKTPQSEYLSAGKFPVVDQGKALIAGYVDDESRLCGDGRPAIVFGDHTRCVKYAGFPFCMGADGVKVLRPKIEADLKYLYYFLNQLEIPNAGYDRHYKYLKRTEVVLQPLSEQRRIAAILDQADALRTKRREALAQMDTLTQSIFIEMFGDPINNAKNFPVRRLIDIVDSSRPITYGILMPGENVEDGVKYVRVVDMKKGGVELSGIRKTTHEISYTYRRSVLKSGDLLMSIRGHVGRLAIVPSELNGSNITQDTVRLAVTAASPVYVREYLRTMPIQHWMARHTKGVAVRGINLGDLKTMPITLPPQKLQDEFSERANEIEALIGSQRNSLSELDGLFASLQQRAFRGEL